MPDHTVYNYLIRKGEIPGPERPSEPLPLPASLRILGKVFSVDTVDPEGGLRTNAIGLCLHNSCQIRISSGIHIHEQKETVLHEVIHAIDNMLSLDMSETQVRSLSACLFAVFRDNQEFGALLSGEHTFPAHKAGE